MYEKHSDHIRGDEVAGRGFGYECLWRSRLMLRLGYYDSLSVYQGEDNLIGTGEGREYYQVKYTTNQWTPTQLKGFLMRATETLTQDESSSYSFCTNVSQSPALKTKFDTINARFGKRSETGKPIDRLRYDVWVLDSEDLHMVRLAKIPENVFEAKTPPLA